MNKQLLMAVFSIVMMPLTYAQSNCYLLLADLHLNLNMVQTMPFAPIGKGSDLDHQSYQHITEAIFSSNAYQQARSVLVLGDLVGHKVSTDQRLDVLHQIYADFAKLKKPTYFVFGNNDSPQGNYQAFLGKSGSSYQIAKSHWPKAISGFSSAVTMKKCLSAKHDKYPCLIAENAQEGHFSILLEKGLRLIAVNSVLLNGDNKENYQRTAQTTIDWLETELTESASANQQVIVAMHVPPGMNLYSHQFHFRDKKNLQPIYQEKFNRVLKTTRASILAILASHTHHEEVHLINTPQQFVPVVVVPGLSTSHGNAPAFGSICIKKMESQWQLASVENAYFTEQQQLRPYPSILSQCNDASLTGCLTRWYKNPDELSLLVTKNYFASNPKQAEQPYITGEMLITD